MSYSVGLFRQLYSAVSTDAHTLGFRATYEFDASNGKKLVEAIAQVTSSYRSPNGMAVEAHFANSAVDTKTKKSSVQVLYTITQPLSHLGTAITNRGRPSDIKSFVMTLENAGGLPAGTGRNLNIRIDQAQAATRSVP